MTIKLKNEEKEGDELFRRKLVTLDTYKEINFVIIVIILQYKKKNFKKLLLYFIIDSSKYNYPRYPIKQNNSPKFYI